LTSWETSTTPSIWRRLLIAFGMTIHDVGPDAMDVMITHVPAGLRRNIEDQVSRAYAPYAGYAGKLYGRNAGKARAGR
jgi:hypothetical protein